MLHQENVLRNPFGIRSNIIEYYLLRIFNVGFILSNEDYEQLAELIISSSHKTGNYIFLDPFETAPTLAIYYPPNCYDTKIYISKELPSGCSNISWHKL